MIGHSRDSTDAPQQGKKKDRPMPTDPRELARALFRDADRKQMRKLKKQKTS